MRPCIVWSSWRQCECNNSTVTSTYTFNLYFPFSVISLYILVHHSHGGFSLLERWHVDARSSDTPVVRSTNPKTSLAIILLEFQCHSPVTARDGALCVHSGLCAQNCFPELRVRFFFSTLWLAFLCQSMCRGFSPTEFDVLFPYCCSLCDVAQVEEVRLGCHKCDVGVTRENSGKLEINFIMGKWDLAVTSGFLIYLDLSQCNSGACYVHGSYSDFNHTTVNSVSNFERFGN
jgi:hypothetical protein